jgi:aminopeptidase N
LVNLDADKMLVCEKTDHKTLTEYAYQYLHAPLYLDRFEALDAAAEHQNDSLAHKIILAGLNDRFPGLRKKAVLLINSGDSTLRAAAMPLLAELARNEPNNQTKAEALHVLAKYKNAAGLPVFYAALKSESYTVQAAGLFGIGQVNMQKAYEAAKGFENDNEGDLSQAVFFLYGWKGNSTDWPYMYKRYVSGTLQEKIHLLQGFAVMIGKMDNPASVQQGIAVIGAMGVKYKPDGAAPYILKFLEQVKQARQKLGDQASADQVALAEKTINDAK